MTLDLTDDEAVALVRCLRHAIEDDRFLLSPRLAPLRAILAKLDPPAAKAEARPLRSRDNQRALVTAARKPGYGPE